MAGMCSVITAFVVVCQTAPLALPQALQLLLLRLPPCARSNCICACTCSTSIHSEIDLRKATRIFRVAFGRLSAMGNQAVDRTTVIAVKPGIHHSLAVTRADAVRHVPWRQEGRREGRPYKTRSRRTKTALFVGKPRYRQSQPTESLATT